MSEQAIPKAADSVVAYFGRNPRGYFRCYCAKCHEEEPLADARNVWGDSSEHNEDVCDGCGAELREISRKLDAAYKEQQARFARQAITTVCEYGVISRVQCKIFY